MNDNTPSLNDWHQLDAFLEDYPQFSKAQLRGLLFNRKHNGLDAHTRKIGKFLYLNSPGFLSWIENSDRR